jgi:hypothetical protein
MNLVALILPDAARSEVEPLVHAVKAVLFRIPDCGF